MDIYFFNTESREKTKFVPLSKERVTLYTCGPTVYNFAHIGNFRTYVFEDLLRRTLTYFGYNVFQVMNLTDVDDKTIRGAIKEGVTLDAYTKPYKDAFFQDLKSLKIQSAERYPAATEYIAQMIAMIEDLLAKKIAYVGADGSVYFSINAFPAYGRLAHLEKQSLEVGASSRVATDEYDKENLSDFVLWKHYDPTRDGTIYWESPFGKGRPGWHLECSAMAISLLGKRIDIHVGGVDNIFPHHENEIAQSECCTGEQFVNLWMHSEHLLVDHKKMSKSLGNFYTLRDIVAHGFTGSEIRYLLLQTHYRISLNFTFEGLKAARQSICRLHDFVYRLKTVKKEGKVTAAVHSLVESSRERFKAHMADDLNISPALAVLFDLVREVNTLMDQESLTVEDSKEVLGWLQEVDSLFDIIFTKEEEIPQEMQTLLEEREKARKNKDFALSDQLRDQIKTAGYIIEDSKTGARLKPIL